jgi:hypothetical protein
MLELNLPKYEHKLRSKEGKLQIFDPIRKKYVHLTPEEWVRQHILNLLNQELDYPASRTSVEGGLKYNGRQKRTDIIVYDELMQPNILVECKAPNVSINKKTIEQLAAYNKTCRAKLLITTNGLQTFAILTKGGGQYEMLSSIPTAKELKELG